MLLIDGSRGEGGGQILRSSLSLSLLTGKAFRIERIRAGRRRPGLLRQHLTAVQAAAAVGGARVEGDRIGSPELLFAPGAVRAGAYSFSVGTAGSTSLVLQTILPALALADAPSTVELRGGTHNPLAPPFDFLARAFFPLLERMGPRVEGVLHRPGFYPAGGGHAVFRITPAARLAPLTLLERGAIRRRAIVATVAHLPGDIGAREIDALADALAWDREVGEVRRADGAAGPGNVVTVDLESDALTEVFTGFGEKGVPAERVAGAVAAEVRQYLDAAVPVGPHLADQLLLWLAIAGDGAFRTVAPTPHTTTQCDVIRAFVDVDITWNQVAPQAWEARVASAAAEGTTGP